jgi:DNA-binding IclR family transcriptional regulator
MERANSPVGAAETLLAVVDGLERHGQVGVTELAAEVGVSKSTVHNHLTTLEAHDYVVSNDGRYRLGLRFLRLGESARGWSGLYDVARPHVDSLVEGTDLVANLAVEEHGSGVYLYRARGSEDIRFSTRAGDEHDLHCTASGKAMLAHMPDERVEEILETSTLTEHTTQTTTDPAGLTEELEQVRDAGVAFDDEEYGPGLRCVGVPVLGQNDEVLGALSLSGPAADMSGEWYRETLPDRLTAAKNRIEVNLRDY